MNIEEKAKRYDEAIERAKSKIKNDKDHVLYEDDVIEIFPEFKESKDDRIRKALLAFFSKFKPYDMWDNDFSCGDIVAWLEKKGEQDAITFNGAHIIDSALNDYCCKQYGALHKENGGVLSFARLQHLAMDIYGWCKKQGEQKPTDKVEPKFKVGDFVKHFVYSNDVYKIMSIGLDGDYKLESVDGIVGKNIAAASEEYLSLWTIQDAKEGDVLCCENGWTCIFKTLVNDETFSSYCFMDMTKWFCETGSECHTLNTEFRKAYNGELKPATKEQRALLFQKMHEAGYEWDADKKELKKIEVKPTPLDCEEICDNAWKDFVKRWNEEAEKYHDAWLERIKGAVSEKTKAQKQEWSEEDEERLSDAIFFVREYQIPTRDKRLLNAAKETENWLITFKDRVQPQSKQEWSEADEVKINRIVACLENLNVADNDILLKDVDWLKSLKFQSQWKPSDEQMAALSDINVTGCISYAGQGQELINLYNDLKRLFKE